MSDVAAAAGVSVSTVSHVINGTRFVEPGTYERVRNAIASLGYRHNHLARAVARGGRTNSIGVALSARSNPYFGELVSALDEAITSLGSTMLLGQTRDDPEREYRLIVTLLERRVDGIVVALAPDEQLRTIELLQQISTPSVLIDRLSGAGQIDEIGSHNTEPVAQLVDHLARVHGHRIIAFIGGLVGLKTTEERREGFETGLTRNRLELHPALVETGESSRHAAERAMAKILTHPIAPTAVVIGNDDMAVGAMRYLRDHGIRVPQDIAVCSFDDFEWAELMASPLSCVAQDWAAIGAGAVALLVRRLEDPDVRVLSQRVDTALHLRASCGCLSDTMRS